MSINLSKGQRIDLTKDNQGLNSIFLGLGWDVAGTGLFGLGSGTNIDLDASCILFDENKNSQGVVYFGNRSAAGIRHNGDNLTGAGAGDDEVIDITLDQIPANVSQIVMTINSFRGQSFDSVKNAFCRIVDKRTNKEVAKYNISACGKHTALIIGSLYRHGTEWKYRAIGENANGRTAHDLQNAAATYL